jgi:hypothetical protein
MTWEVSTLEKKNTGTATKIMINKVIKNGERASPVQESEQGERGVEGEDKNDCPNQWDEKSGKERIQLRE